MANSSGMGAKRTEGHVTRYTKAEMKIFKQKAKSANLSLQDYSLCRSLDYPFHMFGGKEPARTKKKDSAVSPQ